MLARGHRRRITQPVQRVPAARTEPTRRSQLRPKRPRQTKIAPHRVADPVTVQVEQRRGRQVVRVRHPRAERRANQRFPLEIQDLQLRQVDTHPNPKAPAHRKAPVAPKPAATAGHRAPPDIRAAERVVADHTSSLIGPLRYPVVAKLVAVELPPRSVGLPKALQPAPAKQVVPVARYVAAEDHPGIRHLDPLQTIRQLALEPTPRAAAPILSHPTLAHERHRKRPLAVARSTAVTRIANLFQIRIPMRRVVVIPVADRVARPVALLRQVPGKRPATVATVRAVPPLLTPVLAHYPVPSGHLPPTVTATAVPPNARKLPLGPNPVLAHTRAPAHAHQLLPVQQVRILPVVLRQPIARVDRDARGRDVEPPPKPTVGVLAGIARRYLRCGPRPPRRQAQRQPKAGSTVRAGLKALQGRNPAQRVRRLDRLDRRRIEPQRLRTLRQGQRRVDHVREVRRPAGHRSRLSVNAHPLQPYPPIGHLVVPVAVQVRPPGLAAHLIGVHRQRHLHRARKPRAGRQKAIATGPTGRVVHAGVQPLDGIQRLDRDLGRTHNRAGRYLQPHLPQLDRRVPIRYRRAHRPPHSSHYRRRALTPQARRASPLLCRDRQRRYPAHERHQHRVRHHAVAYRHPHRHAPNPRTAGRSPTPVTNPISTGVIWRNSTCTATSGNASFGDSDTRCPNPPPLSRIPPSFRTVSTSVPLINARKLPASPSYSTRSRFGRP